jgi:uncharacterized repeat protein (TIGR01451 family)
MVPGVPLHHLPPLTLRKELTTSMKRTRTPGPQADINSRRSAGWLRRNWAVSLAAAAVVAVLWIGAPAWAAPVARPHNQTVPRPTPTTPGDPLATATPRPDSDDGDGSGGGAVDQEESTGGGGTNIQFPTNPDGTETDPSAAPVPGTGGSADTGLIATVSVGNLNLREGPTTDYNTLGVLTANAQVTVRARTPDGSWWYICCLPNSTTAGWASAQLLTPNFDRAQANDLIPVFGAEVTPTAPAPAGTPVPAVRPAEEAATPLGINFQIDPPFVWQGITATLTITVDNPNKVDVVNAVLSDELPPNLLLISASADAEGEVEQVATTSERPLLLFRWNTIPAETAVTATLVVQMAADLTNGAIVDNLVAVRGRNAAYTTAAITIGMPPVVPPSFD